MSKKRNEGITPMPALAVAVLLVGRDKAKGLKRRWDRRVAHYPKPIRAGSRRAGDAHLYNPLTLIAAAVAAGDVEPEAAQRAIEIIRGLGGSTPGGRRRPAAS
jgi:hypothetical protein